MRKFLFNYLKENDNCVLLHNDMLSYEHDRIINLANSEFITFQYAYGLMKQGYKVLIYDVCNFILDKSYFLRNTLYSEDLNNIIILSAGSGFVYYDIIFSMIEISTHHDLTYEEAIKKYSLWEIIDHTKLSKTADSFQIVSDFITARSLGYNIYVPTNNDELKDLLDKDNKLKYIRLGLENLQLPVVDEKIDNTIPILTYGWLYLYLEKLFTNVVKIIDLNQKYKYDSCIIVEDHVKSGGLYSIVDSNDKYFVGIEENTIYQKDKFLRHVVANILNILY